MFRLPWFRRRYGKGITPPAPDADPRFVGKFCDQPFRMAQSYENGNVHFCCTAWLPVAAGNLHDEPLGAVWNSKWAQAVRSSILDGSYRYCSELNCPRLQGLEGGLVPNEDVRDPYYRRIIDEGLTALPKGPLEISVAHDPTCNLSCPACRSELYKCDGEKRELTRRIHEHMFDAGLRDAQFITMSTNGDPFASPFYLSALRGFDWRAHKRLRINFITNGMRLTPEMWASVKNCHSAVYSMHISVNAATESTFDINQRGGNWKKLLANLEFIASLRRSGAVKLFSLGFYVMNNNFREMKAFVQLAKALKVDSVFFGHVLRPLSLSDEEFAQLAVHLPGHPEHEEFLAVLRDPVLSDPIVRLSNMATLVSGDVATEGLDGSFGARFAEHLSWEGFVRFLALNESAAEVAREVLIQHQRAVARVYQRPAADGGEPPIALLPPFGVDEAGLAALQAFLHSRCPEGETRTYNQMIAELEQACRAALAELLEPTVRPLASRIPVRAMMGVETGCNPLSEASVAFHTKTGGQAGPGLTLANLQRTAELSDTEAEFLRRAINGLKDAFAKSLGLAAGGQDEAGRGQGDQGVYGDRLRAIALREQGVRRGIIARIGEEKWNRIQAVCPSSLLDVDTQYDPFVAEIECKRAAQGVDLSVTP